MVDREKTAASNLKVRVKEPLRARVAAAAEERGVSMNAEFSDRLERSFARDNDLVDAFGSKEVFTFMRAIAGAMELAGENAASLKRRRSDKKIVEWWADPYAFDQAAKAAKWVMEAFRPPGDPSPPPVSSAHVTEAETTRLADTIGSMGAQSARMFISVMLYGKQIVLDDGVVLEALIRGALGSMADQLHMPGDTADDPADDTDGGKHDGEYHSPRQVQLAPKIRGRRARRPHR
jgi:hypothetical protein